MFNILGEYKPRINQKKPTKIKLDLTYPLYSTDSIRLDSQILRLLEDVAKIGLLEIIEEVIESKTIRDVKITKDYKVIIAEKIIPTKIRYRILTNRKNVSEWIKSRHKYITKVQPYSKDILTIVKNEFNFDLSENCEYFFISFLEKNFFNLTPKQFYLKNRNKKKKYDENGNRIR